MAVRRKRIDRTVDLTVNEHNRVVDLPLGWAFTIKCQQSQKEYPFDFERFRRNGREALARQMRDAIWSLRREVTGATLKGYWEKGVTFWNFLDALEAAGEPLTRLDQIDRKVIDQFLAWMERQIATQGKNKGEPLSLRSRKGSYDAFKALLVNRQKRVPEAVSPKLSFPNNPFPNSNKKTPRREEYSVTEQERILAACKIDLARFAEAPEALPAREVLAVHAAIIALLTGVNVTPLLDARRDSLKSFLPDRELLVLEKRRGWSTHAMSLRKEAVEATKETAVAPKQVGDYFRQLCAYTAPLREEAEDGEYVFLYRVLPASNSTRAGEVVRFDHKSLGGALNALVKRHDLRDDRDRPLQLNLARLRPTFATNLYQRTRDIRKVQRALGHSDPNITAQRYLPATTPEAQRDHAFVGQAMVDWATSREEEKAGLLAADGQVPLQDAKALLAGGYNTAYARCKNPFREDGGTCDKFLKCFDCPAMVIFEDDLHRLFSFYYRLLAERAKIAPHHWMKTYGWVVKVIDEQIAPQFAPEVVEVAKREGRENPHPTWATGGMLA